MYDESIHIYDYVYNVYLHREEEPEEAVKGVACEELTLKYDLYAYIHIYVLLTCMCIVCITTNILNKHIMAARAYHTNRSNRPHIL